MNTWTSEGQAERKKEVEDPSACLPTIFPNGAARLVDQRGWLPSSGQSVEACRRQAEVGKWT
jgi:hypothetical protein